MSNYYEHIVHPVPQHVARPMQQYQQYPHPLSSIFSAPDATAQVGLTAVAQGADYVARYVDVSALKHYFNVSNYYVLRKLRLILCPWRHSPWSRLIARSPMHPSSDRYKPPREDINSPDMYIPVMAFVTYILLSGVMAGISGHFRPELLGITASSAFAVILIECLAVKLGCYLLNITSESQYLDLIAYSGYKFVGIIVTMTSQFVFGDKSWLPLIVFFYTYTANAFFLLRSLKYLVLPEASGSATTTATVTSAQRTRRIHFLAIISVGQIIAMWLLS